MKQHHVQEMLKDDAVEEGLVQLAAADGGAADIRHETTVDCLHHKEGLHNQIDNGHYERLV